MKELYVLRTRNLNAPGKWTFRSQTQINQKWAKVLLSYILGEDFLLCEMEIKMHTCVV